MTELKEFLMGLMRPLIVVMDRAFSNQWSYFWSLLKMKPGICALSVEFQRGTGWSEFSQKEGRQDWDSVLMCYETVVGFKASVHQACLFGVSD